MIQYHMDEPLADPAAIALYFVCNLASQSLKVVLSGEGADEIFGGYNVYSEPGGSAYDKLPRGCAAASATLQKKCRHTGAETSWCERVRIWKSVLSETPTCSPRKSARHC